MKNIFVRWLVALALFAVIGEPLAADAHLMLDGAGGAEICSASHLSLDRHSHAPADRTAHQHDCCVAMASFANTGASSFDWQPERLSFAAPQWAQLQEQPSFAWQLRRSRAPPQVLV